MESTRNHFEVKIAGIPLKLKSSNDAQTVNELVALVDDRISHAMANSKSQSLQGAALVAALNIAEELLLLKKQARRELSQVQREAKSLASDLESTQVSFV